MNAGILLFQRYNSFRRIIHRLIAPLKRSLLYKMVAPIGLSSSIPKGQDSPAFIWGKMGRGARFAPRVLHRGD